MNTVNGNIKLNDMCVNIKDLHEEEYFTAIKGHEEGLIAIGMWSSSFLQRNKIQNPLEIFSRKIGDEISISCKDSQTIVTGSITKKRLPRYWKEMIAPYYFESSLRKDKKYNQWIFESQINETGEYKDITFKDEIMYRMLKCIESGSDAYIKSTYIESNELPLYLNITTPYFGNKKAFLKFDTIINNPDHYRPKIITYEYMKKAVVKGISLRVNLKTSNLTVLRNVANENNCLLFGVFIDPYSMHKLLFHLTSDNIKNMIYKRKAIKWTLPLTFHTNVLKLSEVIKVNKDTSRVVLSPQHGLLMNYDRKTSCIVLEKFYYHPENRDVVRLKNKQKLIKSNKNIK